MIKYFIVTIITLLVCTEATAQSEGEINLRLDSELFSHKCSSCHSISEAFESDEVLPSDVWCLVDRMARKDGANIFCADHRFRLYTYLVDWIIKNRSNDLERALECVPDSVRVCEEQKLEEAQSRYK